MQLNIPVCFRLLKNREESYKAIIVDYYNTTVCRGGVNKVDYDDFKAFLYLLYQSELIDSIDFIDESFYRSYSNSENSDAFNCSKLRECYQKYCFSKSKDICSVCPLVENDYLNRYVKDEEIIVAYLIKVPKAYYEIGKTYKLDNHSIRSVVYYFDKNEQIVTRGILNAMYSYIQVLGQKSRNIAIIEKDVIINYVLNNIKSKTEMDEKIVTDYINALFNMGITKEQFMGAAATVFIKNSPKKKKRTITNFEDNLSLDLNIEVIEHESLTSIGVGDINLGMFDDLMKLPQVTESNKIENRAFGEGREDGRKDGALKVPKGTAIGGARDALDAVGNEEIKDATNCVYDFIKIDSIEAWDSIKTKIVKKNAVYCEYIEVDKAIFLYFSGDNQIGYIVDAHKSELYNEIFNMLFYSSIRKVSIGCSLISFIKTPLYGCTNMHISFIADFILNSKNISVDACIKLLEGRTDEKIYNNSKDKGQIIKECIAAINENEKLFRLIDKNGLRQEYIRYLHFYYLFYYSKTINEKYLKRIKCVLLNTALKSCDKKNETNLCEVIVGETILSIINSKAPLLFNLYLSEIGSNYFIMSCDVENLQILFDVINQFTIINFKNMVSEHIKPLLHIEIS